MRSPGDAGMMQSASNVTRDYRMVATSLIRPGSHAALPWLLNYNESREAAARWRGASDGHYHLARP
ncbi:hypothetical protein [Sorlinia euscelidii]|uniref:hypothetical protein n=1 Tax=Sorlinia euscelidii TaxID=3081148 RepID=UPI00374E1DCE